jgi:hypothetical protein
MRVSHSVYLMGVYVTGVDLMGMYLINVHPTGRAPHERVPHRRTPHRRVLYGRVLIFQIQKGFGENLQIPSYKRRSICRDLSYKIRVFALVAGWSIARRSCRSRRSGHTTVLGGMRWCVMVSPSGSAVL